MTASILLPLRRAAINASSATSPQPLSCGNLPFLASRHVCISAINNSMQVSSTTTSRRRLDAEKAVTVTVVRRWNHVFSSTSYADLISKPPYRCHYQNHHHHQTHQLRQTIKSNIHPCNCRQLVASSATAHFSSRIGWSNQFSSGSGDNTLSSSSSSSNTVTTATNVATSDNKKVTTLSIIAKKRRNQKITMVTAYDYPSAVHVDRAGMDIVLVGDSCAMVELGFETTLPITLDQMIHHCQAVKRGAPNRPLLVGDMPFGSYEFENVDVALQNAYRMVKEGGMDAVKFEGGTEARSKIVRHVVQGGIAVLGHVGLTPQAINVLGGFRAQGRKAVQARTLLDEALRLQDAGAFAIVLECIPSNVASAITQKLEIPTIGIGAGGGTSGQVLVFHDLLGMLSHPHHEEFCPKFCKKYASVGIHINDGLVQFKKEVEEGVFPGKEYSPYTMSDDEESIFDQLISNDETNVGLTSENLDESDQLNIVYGSKH